MTSGQCRAARGLLDWTQQELADRAGVGVVTVRQLGAYSVIVNRQTLENGILICRHSDGCNGKIDSEW